MIVTDSVPLNLWISGAEDIAFAAPNFGNYAVYSYPKLGDVEPEIPPTTDGTTPVTLVNELPRAQIFNETSENTSQMNK